MTKITLEVPAWVGPKFLAKYANSEKVDFLIYGFLSHSPLNGGRVIKEDEFILKVPTIYYQSLKNYAKLGIPFYLTYTNLLCEDFEFQNEDVLMPLYDLALSSQENQVQNGVVATNEKLIDFLRTNFSSLDLIASCQRIFKKEKKLSLQERISHYQKDLEKFNTVVLTPQDSFNQELISNFSQEQKRRLVSVINSSCIPESDCHWDYFGISLQNKIYFYGEDEACKVFGKQKIDYFSKIIECVEECKIAREKKKTLSNEQKKERDITKINKLLDLGINNFKLGRINPEINSFEVDFLMKNMFN